MSGLSGCKGDVRTLKLGNEAAGPVLLQSPSSGAANRDLPSFLVAGPLLSSDEPLSAPSHGWMYLSLISEQPSGMMIMQPCSTCCRPKPLPTAALGRLLLENKSSGSHAVVNDISCVHGGERSISQRDSALHLTPKLDEGLHSWCTMLPLCKEGSKSS